jgi:hypothetical protein
MVLSFNSIFGGNVIEHNFVLVSYFNFFSKSEEPLFLHIFYETQIPSNPAHQYLSNNTKGTFQFLQDFQVRFNLIFSEEIIQYSRTFAPQVQTSWNQAHAPLLLRELSKDTKNTI